MMHVQGIFEEATRGVTVWIHAEKFRGGFVIFTFMTVQRPAHLIKIRHWYETKGSGITEETGPMLMLSFRRLTLRQLLGAEELQLFLPHFFKISRLETLCKP